MMNNPPYYGTSVSDSDVLSDTDRIGDDACRRLMMLRGSIGVRY